MSLSRRGRRISRNVLGSEQALAMLEARQWDARTGPRAPLDVAKQRIELKHVVAACRDHLYTFGADYSPNDARRCEKALRRAVRAKVGLVTWLWWLRAISVLVKAFVDIYFSGYEAEALEKGEPDWAKLGTPSQFIPCKGCGLVSGRHQPGCNVDKGVHPTARDPKTGGHVDMTGTPAGLDTQKADPDEVYARYIEANFAKSKVFGRPAGYSPDLDHTINVGSYVG